MKVGSYVSILKKDGVATYFVGVDNYFSHRMDDTASFRYIIATLLDNRHVRACEVTDVLAIPKRTLMGWGKLLREEGHDAFFRQRKRRSAGVMTPDVILHAQELLNQNCNVAEVARALAINASTLHKAIRRGDLQRPAVGTESISEAPEESVAAAAAPSTRSERSEQDAQAAAELGTACHRVNDRVAAAIGLAGCAVTKHEHCHDVSMGGLLIGVPALLANGLFHGVQKHFTTQLNAFYSVTHMLMTMAFMALGRIKRPEHLRHISPGELGKVLGLDRCPEVKTLRRRLHQYANEGDPAAWMKQLSQYWMSQAPDDAGYLYVDGHVRTYSGAQANLPKRFVSRQRLCLSGTTDYWVNDALGKPFFVVSKTVNEGMGKALLNDIVPQLLESVPDQPTKEQLDEDECLHRFVVIFDRECSNYATFAALWEQRIGAITYRKRVNDLWPESEFSSQKIIDPEGHESEIKLAIRETELTARKQKMKVLEVRKLRKEGGQTSIICSARRLDMKRIAGAIFSRWCQENYFAYMMEHYDIDGLVQYGAEELESTALVINPAWREAHKEVQKLLGSVRQLQSTLGGKQTWDSLADLQRQAELLEQLKDKKEALEEAKARRKTHKKRVEVGSLSPEQRPNQLLPLSKMLADCVKMVAFRAETSLVVALKSHLKNADEARAMIRELLVSTADIIPNPESKTLTVQVHRMASPYRDAVCKKLFDDLNKEEFLHPETSFKMVFRLVGSS